MNAVRKPGTFWVFLVLGVLALVGSVSGAIGENWWYAGAQLVVAVLCLSIPFRLAR